MALINTATNQLYPGVPPLGREPRPRRWRHADLRRRHRAERPVLRRGQRIRWRRPPISDTAVAYPTAGEQHRCPAAVDPPQLRQRLLRRHYRAGRLLRRALRLQRVAHRERTLLPGPAQRGLWHRPGTLRLRPRRCGRAPRPHRRARPRPTDGRWSGTRARTPSRATRPWRPPHAVCSSVVTACSRVVCTGRVAFYDNNSLPATRPDETAITSPIEGRVVPRQRAVHDPRHRDQPEGIRRVQVEIQDRDSKQFLQDNGTTWGGSNNIYATLGHRRTNRTWTLPVTIVGQPQPADHGQDVRHQRRNDATKASRRSSRSASTTRRRRPSINGPSASHPTTSTFTMTGTAKDDLGVNSLSYWFRDERTATCRPTVRSTTLQHLPRSPRTWWARPTQPSRTTSPSPRGRRGV